MSSRFHTRALAQIDMLRRRDAGRGAIDFVDIASPSYDPAQNGGVSFEDAMAQIHAITKARHALHTHAASPHAHHHTTHTS
jgi:hypothetical protein